MAQRGGDAAAAAALEQLEKEKKDFEKIGDSITSLPVLWRTAILTIKGYGKHDPKGNLNQLRSYKQQLLNYFREKHKNKPNMKNYTLNAFIKYEANQRRGKITGVAGGKRRTHKSKKSRRVTRRRR